MLLDHRPPRLRRRRSPVSGCRAAGRARAQGYAGLGEQSRGLCRGRCPGRSFAFPADHGPHPDYRIEWWYVTANLVDADGSSLRRAVDAVSAGDAARRRRSKAGPASSSGWAMPRSPAPTPTASPRPSPAAASARPASTPKPFAAWIEFWEMRGLGRRRRRPLAPLQLTRRRRISAMRCGSTPTAAGAAGRSRLQPQIGARPGLLLLQPAVFQGGRPHHASTTSPSTSPARPGWTANGAASRSPPTRPAGTGSRCILPRARS